jgi:hypothetical protein
MNNVKRPPATDLAPDPVIEAFKKDVDRTLLRENLKLTPDERVRKLARFMRSVEEVRAAGAAPRR